MENNFKSPCFFKRQPSLPPLSLSLSLSLQTLTLTLSLSNFSKSASIARCHCGGRLEGVNQSPPSLDREATADLRVFGSTGFVANLKSESQENLNLGLESPPTPQSLPTSPSSPSFPPLQPPGSSLPHSPSSPRSSPPLLLTPSLTSPPPNRWPPPRTPYRPSSNRQPPPRTPSRATAKSLPQDNDRKKESQSESGHAKASLTSKENLNLGKKIGLMFVGIIQVGVVALLLIKRRQLLKNNSRY
ncbi:hypothetical protein TEA_025951 [Camellia sinensis var. sinensis]|uniref:Uncharacterized protein n=1 Tax=Camellia sinensis var. sinensis TaxID=542762 RepID=A0A4S4F2A4_CAMSN|nr:hypothetical protein TEA_025951 [Camellia sinensis var. sinensis]